MEVCDWLNQPISAIYYWQIKDFKKTWCPTHMNCMSLISLVIAEGIICEPVSPRGPWTAHFWVHLRESTWRTFTTRPTFVAYKLREITAELLHPSIKSFLAEPPDEHTQQRAGDRCLCVYMCPTSPPLLLPALRASPRRTSVMLLGSLWDLPRCSTQSSSSPSEDAMVRKKTRGKCGRQQHRWPRSLASRGGEI